ncbi:MAG: hypothetical protein QNK70_05680 [Crocinitomicaceae bacterium]|tara:strand:+ start:5207 stop:5500 length:294 start_codon:yes stop_codon:yes gene_type:complete
MDDKIQRRIAEISEKVKVLLQNFSDLKLENEMLTSELDKKSNELNDLSIKHNAELKSTITTAKNNVTASVSKNLDEKNKEIDTLVREIEICIEELKD